MPPYSRDVRRVFRRVRSRLLEALCRGPEPSGLQAAGRSEQGSAVVEFTFLALLLMVPLVYFIITVAQMQGGSFAVVGAADQAAKVYVAQADSASAQAAAEQAVGLALADFGHSPDQASMATTCDPADCHAPGTAVTVTVRLSIPLPFVPFQDGVRLSATEVEAAATQIVGRFR
ncbi:hypothetical protein HWD94_05100 [Pseudarthrobacter equi]|jgi:Flp pilus assembly protein TadG|nr:hypothetical protein [Pseudarthrobacter equi]MCT9624500.1 hypothetical protein [Pseudarthrobacter equi]